MVMSDKESSDGSQAGDRKGMKGLLLSIEIFSIMMCLLMLQEVKEKDEEAKVMQVVSRSWPPRCCRFRAKDSTWT